MAKVKKIDELKALCTEECIINMRSLIRSYNVVDIETGRTYGSTRSTRAYKTREIFCLQNGYQAAIIKIVISGIRYGLYVIKPYKANRDNLIFEEDEVIIAAICQMKNGAFLYENTIAGNDKYIIEEVKQYCNTTN